MHVVVDQRIGAEAFAHDGRGLLSSKEAAGDDDVGRHPLDHETIAETGGLLDAALGEAVSVDKRIAAVDVGMVDVRITESFNYTLRGELVAGADTYALAS